MERGEDEPLFDERVAEELFQMNSGPVPIPESTEELNKNLFEATGSHVLIPVVTGNSYEDIAILSSEVESQHLTTLVNSWYNGLYHMPYPDEWPTPTDIVVQYVLTNLFCNDGHLTYLSSYFISLLKSDYLNGRRRVYPYLRMIATSKCGKSLNEFYTVLEDLGLVDVLAYDEDYPFEKRKHALYLAGESMSLHPHGSLPKSTTDTIILCLAIVYASRTHGGQKRYIDNVVNAYPGGLRQTTKTLENASLLTARIIDQVQILDYKGELFDYYKDTIALALEILEELYGVDLSGAGRLFDSL